MTMYALVSAGGSPGVTTTALALALTWPGAVVVAECDPAGGDVLAGLYSGHLTAPRGLLSVAVEASSGVVAMSAEIAGQLVPLDDSGSAAVLTGLDDPRQAAGLAPAWSAIAGLLASHSADVIADCGRLDACDMQPLGILAESALVALVLRPSLRQVARARPRIEMLAALAGGLGQVGLLLVGEKGHGPKEIAAALAVPVLAVLPADERTAALLSDGAGRRTGLAGRPLMRAAQQAGRTLLTAGQQGAVPGLEVAGARAGEHR
jgi:hypothetical protein